MKKFDLDGRSKLFLCALAVIFVAAYSYTFDSKLNLGGDDSNYYIYATSLAQGSGYSDISNFREPATSTFPPGYPLLMTPIRLFTDSFVAQKILNGLFLLLSAVLLFLFVRKKLLNPALAFVVGAVALINYRVLDFASMMMSEMSYLAFSTLIIYLLYRLNRDDFSKKPLWKSVDFYLLVAASGFAFQIRTQAVALVVAVFVYLLFKRKWLWAGGYAVGFYLTTLIWTLRNAAAGLGASRYIEQIISVNQWRPEDGYISTGELITRGFDTLKMLLTKAIPGTIMPYLNVDYQAQTTFGEWITAAVLIALIIYGFRQFRGMFAFFMAYTVCTLGLICLWSAPSENRYITTLIPILEMGLVVGVYQLIVLFTKRIGAISPLWLLIPIGVLSLPKLAQQHEIAKSDYPPNYTNFFKIAEAVKANVPPNVVVCSRKPQLFYIYSKGYVCNYKYSLDDREVLQTLIDSRAEYVVLEQLGYASTSRYLYPAIEKNQELFGVVMQLPAPDTYLLKFDIEGAKKKLSK